MASWVPTPVGALGKRYLGLSSLIRVVPGGTKIHKNEHLLLSTRIEASMGLRDVVSGPEEQFGETDHRQPSEV